MSIRAVLQMKRLMKGRAYRKRGRQEEQQRQQTRQRRFSGGAKAERSSFRLHLYVRNEAQETLVRKREHGEARDSSRAFRKEIEDAKLVFGRRHCHV